MVLNNHRGAHIHVCAFHRAKAMQTRVVLTGGFLCIALLTLHLVRQPLPPRALLPLLPCPPSSSNNNRSTVADVYERYAHLPASSSEGDGPFGDVRVTYPFPPVLFRDGDGQNVKGMLRPELILPPSADCVVYGMGIAHDASFEASMAAHCRQVHAFDCTVDPQSPVVLHQPFAFHPLCIGTPPPPHTSVYKDAARTYAYAPLADVMAQLGHSRVDVLKFDIEGAEWALLEEDILRARAPPTQLMFELHSHCANPSFVPPALTAGRDRAAVNRLFAALHGAGYRIASKVLNGGDACCAEFVLVHNGSSSSPHAPLPSPPPQATTCLRDGEEGTCLFKRACVRGPSTLLVDRVDGLPQLGLKASFSGLRHTPDAPLTVQPLPPDASSFAEGVTVLVGRYYAPNHGHVLGDEVFAAWQMLSVWGLERSPHLRVLTDAGSASLQQYKLLFDGEVQVLGQEPVCAETLLAGAARMGYALGMTCPDDGRRGLECRAPYLPEFKHTMAAFRGFVWSRFPPQQPATRLTLLEKDLGAAEHPVRIENADALAAAIPSLQRVMWTRTTLREQVQIMASTAVLISLPGSDLMAAVWLPPASEILQVCRFVGGGWDMGNEQQIWFRMTHPLTVWCPRTHDLPVEEFVRRVRAAEARVRGRSSL